MTLRQYSWKVLSYRLFQETFHFTVTLVSLRIQASPAFLSRTHWSKFWQVPRFFQLDWLTPNHLLQPFWANRQQRGHPPLQWQPVKVDGHNSQGPLVKRVVEVSVKGKILHIILEKCYKNQNSNADRSVLGILTICLYMYIYLFIKPIHKKNTWSYEELVVPNAASKHWRYALRIAGVDDLTAMPFGIQSMNLTGISWTNFAAHNVKFSRATTRVPSWTSLSNILTKWSVACVDKLR